MIPPGVAFGRSMTTSGSVFQPRLHVLRLGGSAVAAFGGASATRDCQPQAARPLPVELGWYVFCPHVLTRRSVFFLSVRRNLVTRQFGHTPLYSFCHFMATFDLYESETSEVSPCMKKSFQFPHVVYLFFR